MDVQKTQSWKQKADQTEGLCPRGNHGLEITSEIQSPTAIAHKTKLGDQVVVL